MFYVLKSKFLRFKLENLFFIELSVRPSISLLILNHFFPYIRYNFNNFISYNIFHDPLYE